MFIGDGAKLVRDAFAIAKEKAQQSLMNWMSLAPIVLTPRKLETVKYR
jgi:hypothetical protein